MLSVIFKSMLIIFAENKNKNNVLQVVVKEQS